MSDPDWDLFPDSLVQSTTAPTLHVGNKDIGGPISLAGPGPPGTLRRLCRLFRSSAVSLIRNFR